MRVYLIASDGDYFGASFKEAEQRQAVMASDRKNRPVSSDTEVVGWYYPEGVEGEPVLTDIGALGYGTTLLLHHPRTDVLRPMLQQVGTVLPMTPWRGESFEAFICDAQLDALDQERMERYPEDHPFFGDMIRRYAFKADVVRDATVFRARGMFGRLFATDRFIDVVQAHGLTGLQVLPLWSSDTGPVGVIEDPMVEFLRYPPGFGNSPAEKRARMRAILAARG